MSFKRDGNDVALLHSLKRRRRDELFSSDIPTDEASFMRDGRLTCLVCRALPILDNLDILRIHRQGKKHLRNLEQFNKHKQEHIQLLDQRIIETQEKGEDAKQLKQQRNKVLSKSSFQKQTVFKSCNRIQRPRIKLNLKETLCEETKQPVAKAAPSKQPSSHSRASCLEKVATTKTTELIQKRDLSHLNEEEKVKRLKEETKYLSQGWLRDNCGNWVQDPTVEFDSDEESPL